MLHLKIIWGLATLLAAAAPAFAADKKPCTSPDMPLRPIMSTHTIPPYPELAVKLAEQGITLIQVHIGPDGVITEAAVLRSSGSVRLDEAAVQHVKDVWRWNAPIIQCQPVPADTRVSVKWDIRDPPVAGAAPTTIVMDKADYPPGPLQRREQGSVSIMVMLTTKGTVALTRILVSSGFPELDAKSQEIISRWRWTPATMNGSPISTGHYLITQWRIDDGQKEKK